MVTIEIKQETAVWLHNLLTNVQIQGHRKMSALCWQ